MRYYLIAGEASGDLHASHLIAALKTEDPKAQFRGLGGDLMHAEGMTLVRHYRELAYMGIIPVLLHARTILRGMAECKADIAAWQPDVVILVDYPGFNLKMAHYVHSHAICPVYYYIAPKLWAWKEYRIRDIRRDVDQLFSILPFEVDFFEGKHHYPIHYVGNPTVDEVEAYKVQTSSVRPAETLNSSDSRPPLKGEGGHLRELSSSLTHSTPPLDDARKAEPSVPAGLVREGGLLALLPGSRKQEISSNLSRMIAAAAPFADSYRIIVAGAPGIEPSFYEPILAAAHSSNTATPATVVYGHTYDLLANATAARVTSGTATLETALFRVPQVVCYYMRAGRLASLARRLILNIPFISLVNLIADREVVPELVAEQMNVDNLRRHLAAILPRGAEREAQLQGYEDVARRLGQPGAPRRAARLIVQLLSTTAHEAPHDRK